MYLLFVCFWLQRESNDSGTESDGELLDVENKRHLDVDMETSEYPQMTKK